MKRFILWHNNDEERLELPVNPKDFEMKTGLKNEIVDIQDVGEINLIGHRLLDSITLKSFFPNRVYSFCTYKLFPVPYDCVALLRKWQKTGLPIRLIITETDINHAMAIESFEYSEKDGTGDVYFTLNLKEYRFLNVSQANNNNRIDKATELKERPSEKQTPKEHLVKSGDSLWTLAKKYYNDGKRWKELAQKNNILDPDKLEVGRSLKL